MNKIDGTITETLDSFLNEELICEFRMKPKRMIDKYGDILDPIVDNLVAICLYPTHQTTTHWRERSYSLCARFANIDIDPIRNNTYEFRLKCLNKAVVEILNKDFSAIRNHFKSVSVYYAKKENPHERIYPYKPYNECYEENKEKVKAGIIAITEFVAKQDYNGLMEYMTNF